MNSTGGAVHLRSLMGIASGDFQKLVAEKLQTAVDDLEQGGVYDVASPLLFSYMCHRDARQMFHLSPNIRRVPLIEGYQEKSRLLIFKFQPTCDTLIYHIIGPLSQRLRHVNPGPSHEPT